MGFDKIDISGLEKAHKADMQVYYCCVRLSTTNARIERNKFEDFRTNLSCSDGYVTERNISFCPLHLRLFFYSFAQLKLLTGMDTLTSFKTLKQIYWFEKDREREKKTVKETREKKKAKNDKKNWSINITSKLDKNL